MTTYTTKGWVKNPYNQLQASHIKYIDKAGVEQVERFTHAHKAIYNYLLGRFTYLNANNDRVLLTNGTIGRNTDTSVGTIKSALKLFIKMGLVVIARRSYKDDGTYRVTQYLNVVDIGLSDRHKYYGEQNHEHYKAKAKDAPQEGEKWTYAQLKQYRDNKSYIQRTKGRYMTCEEKEIAHLAAFTKVGFELGG